MRAACASREPDQPATPAEEVVADGVRACRTRTIPYLVAKYIYIDRISVFSCYARYSEEGGYCPPREESAGQAEFGTEDFGKSESRGLAAKSRFVQGFVNF